jgi:hypothetical protein
MHDCEAKERREEDGKEKKRKQRAEEKNEYHRRGITCYVFGSSLNFIHL